MPQMDDPSFRDSIVYILTHDRDGAWGVVINRGLGMRLSDIFDQLDIEPNDSPAARAVCSNEVLFGGPVHPQHGLVLHAPDQSFDSTQVFDGGVAISSSQDVLQALAEGKEPQQNLVLLGHAGWSAGQLESEIGANAWLTCDANLAILFDTPIAERREAAAALLGIDLASVVGQSGRA